MCGNCLEKPAVTRVDGYDACDACEEKYWAARRKSL
jgi:hypothetical protein